MSIRFQLVTSTSNSLAYPCMRTHPTYGSRCMYELGHRGHHRAVTSSATSYDTIEQWTP